MKVQTTKELNTVIGTIPIGLELNTKELYPGSETFLVQDGRFKGIGLPLHAIKEVQEEKTYTEKQVKDIENYWMKEIKTLKFFVKTLADCLTLTSEEIDRLRKELENAK